MTGWLCKRWYLMAARVPYKQHFLWSSVDIGCSFLKSMPGVRLNLFSWSLLKRSLSFRPFKELEFFNYDEVEYGIADDLLWFEDQVNGFTSSMLQR